MKFVDNWIGQSPVIFYIDPLLHAQLHVRHVLVYLFMLHYIALPNWHDSGTITIYDLINIDSSQ